MNFGSPFRHHFESLFDNFCHLKHQNVCLDCRHDFYWLLNGQIADFWCSNLSNYMVNTDVFIRFHFFDFFVNLRISGTNLEFILGTFEGLGRLLWWFLCVLDMHWNFVDFQRRPKLRHPSQEVVKGWSVGAIATNKQPAGSCKIWNLQAESWQALRNCKMTCGCKICCLESYNGCRTCCFEPYPPQPGGPWQAGAGGYVAQLSILFAPEEHRRK